MCGMCPNIGGCGHLECGGREPIDPVTGKSRKFYIHWFQHGDEPCHHIKAEHKSDCETVTRYSDCTCWEDDDETY